MLKKLLAPAIIATALIAPLSAQAQLNLSLPSSSSSSVEGSFMIWSAFNLGGRSITSSYDVKRFLEVAHLTDSMLVDMFNQANGDYSKYNAIKDKWLNQRLKEGIKQMAYIRMVQKYATRKFIRKEWKAFKITESEYFKQVQEMETKALKTLLDERKGIVYARQKFGEQLIEAGYPVKKGQTAEELYWDWYNLQKERIKENYRIKEVKKFEYLTALGYAKEFYVRPVEIFDFAREMNQQITDKIQNKRISQGQVSKLISETSGIEVMLKGVTFYGPETTKLKELKSAAPQVYSDFLDHVNSNVVSFIKNEFSSKLKRYETIAKQMASKYNSTQTLHELSNKVKKEFLASNDYNRLMMAKIYDLAIIGLEHEVYTQKKSEQDKREKNLESYISALSRHSLTFLSDEDSILSETNVGVRLEDNFSAKINEDFHSNQITGMDSEVIKNSAYLDEVRKLAHWVLKFQIKKASLNTVPMAVAELYDVKSYEGQNRIEKYLKNKQYVDKVEEFKTRTLKAYFMGILTINPTGHDFLRDAQAVNFVLGIEEENSNELFDLFNQD